MIVVMAGLPGTGKSTIARQLAGRLSAEVLDKDAVRGVLFSPGLVEYSTRQDDFCVDILLETAGYLLRHDAVQHVILDGRPFSRRYQVERVERVSEQLGAPVRIIECVCSTETAHRRLSEDASGGNHVAHNRDVDLYLKIKATFEPIEQPKLLVDTEQNLERCVAQCLAYLHQRPVQAVAM